MFLNNDSQSNKLNAEAVLPILGTNDPTSLNATDVHTIRASSYNLATAATNLDQEPNNNPSTATDLGTLSGTLEIQGSVDFSNDFEDFYRINLGETSSLSVTLDGMSSDADVQVLRDVNNDGRFDSRDIIDGSFNGGTNPESINLEGLGSGTYLIRVSKFNSDSTNYDLTLTATAGAGRERESNETLDTANDLEDILGGTIRGHRVIEGSVNSTDDSNDFYSFTSSGINRLNLSLSGLSSDANLRLIRDFNNNGRVDENEIAASSLNAGTAPERINNQILFSGRYFIQVENVGSEQTDYKLDLVVEPARLR